MVNGVQPVFVGSFVSDQLSFWVKFPFNLVTVKVSTKEDGINLKYFEIRLQDIG